MQLRQRIEPVGFDRLNNLRIKRSLLSCGAKGAVAHMSTRAPCNLRNLGCIESAGTPAVKFVDPGKGDMVEIHVEPHSDRVRGNEIIDLAGLKHADLSVARTGAQSPENDRGASAPAADDLGKGKHVCYGECDDGAAGRQPCHLLMAGIGERRKAGPAHMFDVTDEPPHQWLYRVCAEEHCLLETAGVQEACGKHVASLGIGAELDLIDR